MSLTLIEQLPKEKTSVLGTAEVSLSDLVYKSLEYKNNVFNESCDADEKLVIVGCDNNNNNNNDNNNNAGATNQDGQHPTTDGATNGDNSTNQTKKPNEGNDKSNTGEEGEPTSDDSLTSSNPNDIASYLTITKTAPIIYLNPRLLPANNNKGDDELMKGPEFTVEVTISNFLIDPEIIEHSNFINLHLSEVYPVPEEWSLKEGSEKDLNSSKTIKKIKNKNKNQSINIKFFIKKIIIIIIIYIYIYIYIFFFFLKNNYLMIMIVINNK